MVGGYFPAWSRSPLPFLPVPLGVDEPVHKVLGLHLVQVAGEVAGEGAFRVSLDVGCEASGALGFVWSPSAREGWTGEEKCGLMQMVAFCVLPAGGAQTRGCVL